MPRTNIDKTARKLRQFNDFVKAELNRQKKTQSELGEYLNKDRQNVVNRLCGKVKWTFDEAIETADFLGVAISEIIE